MAATAKNLPPCAVCGVPHRPATARQRAFCERYLVSYSPTTAAREAGYSPKSPSSQAYQLLQSPAVQCQLSVVARETSQRTRVDADFVLTELASLARVDVGDFFDAKGNMLPLDAIPVEARRAISSIKTNELWSQGSPRDQVGVVREVRFWPKVQALELLGKNLALWINVNVHATAGRAEDILAGRKRAGMNGDRDQPMVPGATA